jgi:hypothetical protein
MKVFGMMATLATAAANGFTLPEYCLQCDPNATNTVFGAYQLCSDEGLVSIWWQIPHTDGESYQEPICVAAIEYKFVLTPLVVATKGICSDVKGQFGSSCLGQIAENTLESFLPSNSEFLIDEGEVADYHRTLEYLASTFNLNRQPTSHSHKWPIRSQSIQVQNLPQRRHHALLNDEEYERKTKELHHPRQSVSSSYP